MRAPNAFPLHGRLGAIFTSKGYSPANPLDVVVMALVDSEYETFWVKRIGPMFTDGSFPNVEVVSWRGNKIAGEDAGHLLNFVVKSNVFFMQLEGNPILFAL